MNKELRLGLTMRIVKAEGYDEIRDALAHDWYGFMQSALPEAEWLPIPNLGDSVNEFIGWWKINGFIITGGNDLFDAPIRDETELAVVDYAVKNNLPVLGICRGLQVICHYFGNKVEQCPVEDEHVATKHVINLVDSPVQECGHEVLVNSFHDNCVGNKDNFSDVLKPFAFSHDGLVEAVYSKTNRIMGLMWHPERERPITEFDKKLVRKLFNH